jgi:hypothetical protein
MCEFFLGGGEKGARYRKRRAPLQKSRNGLMKNHAVFILARKRGALQKGIHDSHAVDGLPVLHIFAEQHSAAGFFRRAENQRIPDGKAI